MKWVFSGIRTGIHTTAYPRATETAAGVTPGLPLAGTPGADAAALVARCPTHALAPRGDAISVDYRRCVHCDRCKPALAWQAGYEWAGLGEAARARGGLGAPFRRSIHVLVVDAGDCGACLNEVRQLNNPYYNMHRLGFFITPTPRHADVLLVVGPVTDHMRVALKKIYDAMPTPKRVMAVGACALSGGVFAQSFVCAQGAGALLPVDVEVPGHPPPPLAILHGLLVAAGRREPASLASEPTGGPRS
jgi:Ni,Fe-hydrogenase III small subunit